MKIPNILSALGGLSVLLVSALSLGGPPVSSQQTESEIASKIHNINTMEIEAGHLAVQKGTTAMVRAYGERLVRDHSMADQKLLLAMKQGHLPGFAEGGQEDREAMIKKLQVETGIQFDKTFLDEMVRGHKEAIQMLTKAHDQLPESSALKTYIGTMLPILGQHEQVAMNLEKRERATG